MYLKASQLSLPPDPICPGDLCLSESDYQEIAKNLIKSKAPTRVINAILVNPTPEDEDPRREILRKKLIEEFTGTVFRDEVFKDPPVRGRYGYAYIPLKDGAVPTRAKPWVMQCVRGEAHLVVTEDWEHKGFIEKPASVTQLSHLLIIAVALAPVSVLIVSGYLKLL